MFKKRTEVFYRFKIELRRNKTRDCEFNLLNIFEDILDKGCLSRVHSNYAFMNVGKISYEISMQGNLISQCFEFFL